MSRMDPRKGEILNVDLDLKLRIMGQAHHSLHIDTDEGDGYTFMSSWNCEQGINPELEPKPHHYEEWVSQLEYIVDWMKDKIGPQNVRRKNRFQILKGKDSC